MSTIADDIEAFYAAQAAAYNPRNAPTNGPPEFGAQVVADLLASGPVIMLDTAGTSVHYTLPGSEGWWVTYLAFAAEVPSAAIE